MNTIHTFHLPFREMIITPLDFVVITRLSFSKEPVLFSSEAYSSIVVRKRWLKDMFGVTTFVKLGCSFLFDIRSS